MKVKAIVLFSVLLLGVLIVSCSNNNGTGPSNNNELILPLTLGNEWQYVAPESDSVNTILKVIDSQNLNYNDEDISVFSLNWIEENYIDTLLIFNKDDGLYYLSPNFDNDWLFLKYPVNVDDFWYNPFEEGPIKCLSTNQSVGTPAGNFNCFVYGFYYDSGDLPYLEIYCHPDIGIVALHSDIDDEENWSFLNTYILN